jgi:hypothetical protein
MQVLGTLNNFLERMLDKTFQEFVIQAILYFINELFKRAVVMHEEGWEMSKVVLNVVKRKVGEINLGQLSRKRHCLNKNLESRDETTNIKLPRSVTKTMVYKY